MDQCKSKDGENLFKLEELIGEGTFGSVYVGSDIRDPDRKVAIKVNKGKIRNDTLNDLCREAIITDYLTRYGCQDCIQFIYQCMPNKSRVWIILEYLDPGEGWRSFEKYYYLADVDQEVMLLALANLSRALEEIHRLGVVHHDLNMGNLMINIQTGQVKLIDFGMSCLVNPEFIDRLNPQILKVCQKYIGESCDYGVFGTSYYMHPRWRTLKDKTPRSDEVIFTDPLKAYATDSFAIIKMIKEVANDPDIFRHIMGYPIPYFKEMELVDIPSSERVAELLKGYLIAKTPRKVERCVKNTATSHSVSEERVSGILQKIYPPHSALSLVLTQILILGSSRSGCSSTFKK